MDAETRVFPFEFDPRYELFLRAAGVRPGNSQVRLTADRLIARFGPWIVKTPLTNVSGACITGPYRSYRAIGARLSFADRGVTFGSTCAGGVCVLFHEPVTGHLVLLRLDLFCMRHDRPSARRGDVVAHRRLRPGSAATPAARLNMRPYADPAQKFQIGTANGEGRTVKGEGGCQLEEGLSPSPFSLLCPPVSIYLVPRNSGRSAGQGDQRQR